MSLTLGTNNEMTTEGLRRKMLLRQMTGISPTGLRGSTRLPLSPQSGSHSGGSASVPGSPLGSPMRPVTAYFDGRQTVPVKRRLQSAGRTRRTNFPTGVATPGMDAENPGLDLSTRLRNYQLYVKPPRARLYVNDPRRGSFEIVGEPEPPHNAPKGQEFARLGLAIAMGGVFPRGPAGCVPFRP